MIVKTFSVPFCQRDIEDLCLDANKTVLEDVSFLTVPATSVDEDATEMSELVCHSVHVCVPVRVRRNLLGRKQWEVYGLPQSSGA